MRSLTHRLLRATVIVVVALSVALAAVVSVNAAAEHLERGRFPAPGQLVGIGGGERIHIRTWGERIPGEPALLLDVSASLPSSAWAWVGRMLGARHFVVAYDRPGMAWSDGPDRTRDAMSAARALTSALDVAGIGPPYVVIAHSYGGFSARAFVGLNSDGVDGLVLLDTTHPDGGGEAGFAAIYRARAWHGRLALFRLFPPGNGFAGLPEEDREGAYAVSHWTSHLDTTAEELEAWATSAAQIRPLDFADLPLLVVSANGSEAHQRLQHDLLSLSSDSRFVELNVDHVGMLVSHDQAILTTQAIESFIDAL